MEERPRVQTPGWRRDQAPQAPRCPVCGAPLGPGAVLYRDAGGRAAGCEACLRAQYL